ncbi:MAG: hypothetical protein IIB77_10000, partial [Proteobacteria bacterium]|nr:hypothetical protein [Pseudomonadota bacterium]
EEHPHTEDCIQQIVDTFSLCEKEAREHFNNALAEWKAIGLLSKASIATSSQPEVAVNPLTKTNLMPALPDLDWANQFNIELAGNEILIFLEHREYLADVEQIIGHLRRPRQEIVECKPSKAVSTDLTIHVCQMGKGYGIYQNGLPVAHFSSRSALGPTVKSVMIQVAIDASDAQFYFHAGAMADGNKLFLFPGERGAGKSTLTSGLMRSGMTYYSDEVVLMRADSPRVRPFPLALCSKENAWEHLQQWMPEIKELPIYKRLDEKTVKYCPPDHNPFSAAYDKALEVAYLIFPRFDPNLKTTLLPLSRTEALKRLMDQCIAIKEPLNETNVEQLVDWIGGVDCYELPNNSLEQAIAAIKSLH